MADFDRSAMDDLVDGALANSADTKQRQQLSRDVYYDLATTLIDNKSREDFDAMPGSYIIDFTDGTSTTVKSEDADDFFDTNSIINDAYNRGGHAGFIGNYGVQCSPKIDKFTWGQDLPHVNQKRSEILDCQEDGSSHISSIILDPLSDAPLSYSREQHFWSEQGDVMKYSAPSERYAGSINEITYAVKSGYLYDVATQYKLQDVRRIDPTGGEQSAKVPNYRSVSFE